MPTLDIFSIPVELKFRTRLFTVSSFVVFIFITAAVILPLIIAYQAGGFWLKNRMYIESPKIRFKYKYLLLAERDFDTPPVVCSTFSTYRGVPIEDNCIIIKVREEDINKDRQRDLLKFESKFWSDQPIRSVKLLLWFEFQLKDIIEHNFEALVAFHSVLQQDTQEFKVIGDLKLNQRGVIRSENFPEIPTNETVELTDYSVDEVLSHYARKMFSAQLINTHITQKTGFANDMPVTIAAEIFYIDQLLYYQPWIWEELKWAWIQYLSLLFVTMYFARRILKRFFTRGRLRSYIVTPWKEKQ